MPLHINQKEMYVVNHLLFHFCEHHPDALRRDQVLIGVDDESVVEAFL